MVMTAPQYLGQNGGFFPSEEEMTDWSTTISDLARQWAEYETAQKCLDINLARAQQGLPPIDCASYGTGVNIGIAPATQNTLLLVVAILAGVYLLPKLLK